MRVPRKIFSTVELRRDSFWFSGFGHSVASKAPARRGGEKRSMKRRAGAFVSNHYGILPHLRTIPTRDTH